MFPGEKITIFSDEIEWCKNHPLFQGERFSFSEGNDAVQDLNLMASCRHHICSNSTLAWWACFLGKAEDKIVVCPKQELWGHPISLPVDWIQI
jgi:hypothetical protein